MISAKSVETLQKKWENFSVLIPDFQIVLGSGFGNALDALDKNIWKTAGEISFQELPGFPDSTAPDHAGKYRVLKHLPTGKSVLAQMGRLHGYEGHPAASVVQTVMLPRLAGVKNFILTNAAGALTLEYKPGDVMILRDHINLTGQNPLAGDNPKNPEGKEIGPRFPDLCALYDRELRASLKKEFLAQGLGTHEGVYVGLLGPSFETPAEVALFASWGLQAVGMSTVWEAIALKHSGARVAGLSLISNLGAGMGAEALDHFKILETCRFSAERIVRGVLQAVAAEWTK